MKKLFFILDWVGTIISIFWVIVLLLMLIFGGEISIKINWHSWTDLLNYFKKH